MGGRRDVVILGATGSIGTQALDVIGRNRDAFRVVGLAAGGVSRIAVADATAADAVLTGWRTAAAPGDSEPVLLLGPEAATELAGIPVHTVLNGMTGSIGLLPTLAALDAGNTLALANKESLIVGGPIVLAAAAEGQIRSTPHWCNAFAAGGPAKFDVSFLRQVVGRSGAVRPRRWRAPR
jgi:1-deoxy-D-xylulose-5-phosphate reductoisomerase